jgi:hypothetical protein
MPLPNVRLCDQLSKAEANRLGCHGEEAKQEQEEIDQKERNARPPNSNTRSVMTRIKDQDSIDEERAENEAVMKLQKAISRYRIETIGGRWGIAKAIGSAMARIEFYTSNKYALKTNPYYNLERDKAELADNQRNLAQTRFENRIEASARIGQTIRSVKKQENVEISIDQKQIEEEKKLIEDQKKIEMAALEVEEKKRSKGLGERFSKAATTAATTVQKTFHSIFGKKNIPNPPMPRQSNPAGPAVIGGRRSRKYKSSRKHKSRGQRRISRKKSKLTRRRR